MDAPAQTPAMPTAKQPTTNTVALHLGIRDAAAGLGGMATLAFSGGPGILRAMPKKPYATIESKSASELCICGWLMYFIFLRWRGSSEDEESNLSTRKDR